MPKLEKIYILNSLNQTNRFHFTRFIFFLSVIFRITLEANLNAVKFKGINSLSSLQAYSSLQNPLISKNGFTSGSDLLFTSLPLRIIYEIASWLNLEAITAMQLHILTEILFQNLVLAFAIKTILDYRTSKIIGTLTFFNLFQIVAPINLANWGIIYGWNYGFAYSLSILSLTLALRKRFGKLVLVTAMLLSTHFTVGIITGSLCIFLILIDYQNVKITKKDLFYVTGAIPFIVFSLSGIFESLQAHSPDFNRKFLERIKLFQVHLFVDLFNVEKMRELIPSFLHWSAIFCTVIIILQSLKKQDNVFVRLEYALHFIFVVSIVSCVYSQINNSNSTLILIAFHRLSIFVPYIFILLLPIFFEGAFGKKRFQYILIIMVMAIHVIGLGRLTDLISFTVCLVSIYVYLKNLSSIKFNSHLLSRVSLLSEIVFVSYLCVLSLYLYLPIRIFFLVVAFLVSIYFLYDIILNWFSKFSLRVMTRNFTLIFIIISFIGLVNITRTQHNFVNSKSSSISKDYNLEIWAKENTKPDSVFFLPPNNDSFGWESFSERASVGKPMDWLHYSILYSRDEAQFIEGANKAELFGVDVQNILQNKKSEIGIALGNQIINDIYTNYRNTTDERLIEIANELRANYLITEGRKLDLSGVILVYEDEPYRVYQLLKIL
jgi:hypothetical protein